jgi:methylglutaconyl-CoA hydratase
MGYEYLTTRRERAIEYLTLNRPDVRNAFNETMIAELTSWASATAEQARVGVVRAAVLAGVGPTFCAGADVAWMAKTIEYTAEENRRDALAAARMLGALNDLPIPLIGRVHGAAIGGGAGLCAVCDVVIAAETAVFGFTEVKLGILPAVIAPFSVAKIGRSAARELFLTGARFSAVRAREIGLVHRVAADADLDAAVADVVREILSAGPAAIAAAKSLIPEVWERTAEAAREITADAIAARRVSAEGQEGLRAFLEKRKPGWTS